MTSVLPFKMPAAPSQAFDTEEERLVQSLRLHDQMLSCLAFTAENAEQLHGDGIDLSPLRASIQLIAEKRVEVIEAFAREGLSADRALAADD